MSMRLSENDSFQILETHEEMTRMNKSHEYDLPLQVDERKISSQLKHGVLELHIPRVK
jgi:HSP20 family molecular chaperone IbpA